MPRIITPGSAYKHLQRYRQVVRILTKYGFGEFFGQIRFWEYVNIEKRLLHREGEFAHGSSPQRMRLAMEELGPTFVKLGQMLSTRPDILPPNFITEFENLQNRVAPMPSEVARQIIEAELKKPITAVFSSFEDQPLAAASLAQVHRATVEGAEVVIKVQRPNIVRVIEVDLEIMNLLAALMERYVPGAYAVNPVGLVTEFSENIKKELDFRIEANNMKRFAQNFADTPWVHVPKLSLESCCTRRLLIMEYVQGISISDTERLKNGGYDLGLIAQRGAEIGLRSALEFGFFHADPHPGNLIIMPGNVFGLLDYGMMGSLSKSYRERLGRMVYNIVNDDEKRTARSLIGLMESREAVDASALETEVSKIIQQYVHIPLRDVHLGNVLFQLIHILREHHLRFPTHLIWLSKAITTVEDVAHRLDPDFDMLSYARPYVRRFVLKNLNPVKQVQEAFLTTLDSLDLLKDLPYDAGIILDQLKKGRVKIEFEHIGLEPFKKTLTDITNQLAITIILAAVLISSALVIVAGVPPKIGEIPVMGIAGFILAGLLLISLILSMIFRR